MEIFLIGYALDVLLVSAFLSLALGRHRTVAERCRTGLGSGFLLLMAQVALWILLLTAVGAAARVLCAAIGLVGAAESIGELGAAAFTGPLLLILVFLLDPDGSTHPIGVAMVGIVAALILGLRISRTRRHRA